MIRARDVMRKNTPVLDFDQTVSEAIVFLQKKDHGFVAVRASEDRYQGVLTEASLMRVYMRFQTQTEKESLIFYRDLFEPLQLISENEPFPEIVKKVVTAIGNRVFVIDEQTKVVGFITAKDILPLLAGGAIAEQVIVKNQSTGQDGEDSKSLNSNLYLYESFFTNSPFMMHSVNQEGTIQMANEVLHRVLDYEYPHLIGKTIFEIYPLENHQKAREGLQKILDSGFHNITQGQMLTKDGARVDVELVSKALRDQNNRPLGTITVSRPIDMKVLLKVLPG